MAHLTPEQRSVIIYLHKQHRSMASIAREIGCSKASVHRWVTQSYQGRGVAQKPRVARPLLLDDSAAKRAEQLLRSDEVGGSRLAAAQLFREELVPKPPSRQTVMRAAKRVANEAHDPLVYTRSAPKKKLTEATKKKRVAFCRANLNRDWGRVMFTDRCKFHFKYPGSKVQRGRWTRRSEKDSQQVYTPNHPQCYNVYGGITMHGTSKLVAVAGTDGQASRYHNQKGQRAKNITAEEYEVVVGRHLLPAGEGQFSCHGVRNWVLQQDRDPTHTVAHRAVDKFNALGFSSVEVLPDWPGNSHDLSPIENVWSGVLDEVQKKRVCRFLRFQETGR